LKRDSLVWANGLALTTAVVWVVCSLITFLFPSAAEMVFGWWMHGMDVSALMPFNITLTNFFLGGVTMTVSAWLTGYVLGWSLTYFSRRK